jgi:ribosomal protein S18 acetylase RimI-like enzyme
VVDLERALTVERHHAEWFLNEGVVPGAEVHRDRDVVWVVHAGQAWRNAGIMVRFTAGTAARRLDILLRRYKRHGRGMALWISPSATPADLPTLLQARKLRCRSHFPAMLRTLRRVTPGASVPAGIEIRAAIDVDEYERTPHPAIGPITTPLRRQALERLRALVDEPSGRTRAFVAWLKGKPVGAIEIFLGREAAGIHGLSVLDEYQRRGIGSALIEHGCLEAAASGADTVVLLATGEGQHLYLRRGFKEVARFGYWYRSFQRGR